MVCLHQYHTRVVNPRPQSYQIWGGFVSHPLKFTKFMVMGTMVLWAPDPPSSAPHSTRIHGLRGLIFGTSPAPFSENFARKNPGVSLPTSNGFSHKKMWKTYGLPTSSGFYTSFCMFKGGWCPKQRADLFNGKHLKTPAETLEYIPIP